MSIRARGFRAAAAVLSSGALLATAACGGGGDGGDDGDVTLVIETFGTFGYEELIKQFEEENPGITVEERVTGELADYTPVLQQNIAAGSGAGDVVAVEEGIIRLMMEQADAFHDLSEYGAGEMEDHFLDWKWEMGHTPDGKLMGLGTDIGGMAMCYRADMFEDAGLPSDREELTEEWKTWEDFLEFGEEFRDSGAEQGFVADVGEIYSAQIRQSGDVSYFNRDDELIFDSNPVIEEAWDYADKLVDEGLTASLETFSDDWTAGIQAGAFATMPCPAWMLGQVEEAAGESGRGKWDVTEVPGPGGNWGGSWLAVPTQTEHPEEAAELAKFLTGPEGHLGAWEARNNLPSSPETLQSDEVQNATREYFRDAPTGQIYAQGALDLEPVYMGTGHQAVHEGVTGQLDAFQRGELSRDEAWEAAVDEAERAVR